MACKSYKQQDPVLQNEFSPTIHSLRKWSYEKIERSYRPTDPGLSMRFPLRRHVKAVIRRRFSWLLHFLCVRCERADKSDISTVTLLFLGNPHIYCFLSVRPQYFTIPDPTPLVACGIRIYDFNYWQLAIRIRISAHAVRTCLNNFLFWHFKLLET